MKLKFVIAPDSFKGSLSAGGVTKAVAAGIREVVSDAEIVQVSMADGGEGTVEAMVESGIGLVIRVVHVHVFRPETTDTVMAGPFYVHGHGRYGKKHGCCNDQCNH